MSDALDAALEWLLGVSDSLLLLVLAVAAALENVVPPIPADAVVAFGGFLAARRELNAGIVFVVVWLANVAGALVVYAASRRYGPAFFRSRIGGMLLAAGQLRRLDQFYRSYGVGVIFVSRFLPMFRAVVPAFAGVAGLGFWRTALPLSLASGLWYGAIVYVAVLAGVHWEVIVQALASLGRWLGVAALLVLVVALRWWWTTRREPH